MYPELYEVGVIKNGIPTLRVAFLKPDELEKINPLLFSGFIQVLNDFIDTNFEDAPKRLELHKFVAHFCPIVEEQNDTALILYAFTSTTLGRSALDSVMENIKYNIQKLLITHTNGNGTLLKKIESLILQKCAPLIQNTKSNTKLKYF